MLKIKRALVSVSDKNGIVDFARTLAGFGVEIVSTGGTAKVLQEAGIPVVEMSDYTGFPEMLDGRLKSLHPKIHGGLLSLRDNPQHMREIEKQGIGLIDMVVVNLYPFEATVKKESVTLEEAIENIDIGGPSMLRSAAKNHRFVAVVSDPKFYDRVTDELKENDGCLTEGTLKDLAAQVFRLTSRYDGQIFKFLETRFKGLKEEDVLFPSNLVLDLARVTGLRYGENPHQKAALYKEAAAHGATLASARQLQGKELSFNNYLDLNAAFALARDFTSPCACIVKHTNPTGVAIGRDLVEAYTHAWKTDPLSAFGGIVGLNRPVDAAAAQAIVKSGFLECIVAPGYDRAALDLFAAKKNLRLLEADFRRAGDAQGLDLKKIDGGLLVQEQDTKDFPLPDLKTVTKKKPTKRQMDSLFFAWKVVKHVKSNAIVLAQGARTVGIGMGQTSRVDSVYMAVKRAGSRSKGSVLASDAFFPKADNIALAKKAGVKAIIQPGGSVADTEVIAACDRAGIAMVFTGIRHFKH